MGPETKTDFLRLLGLAKRAGRAELGEDGVSGAAADGKARVVFLAVDAAKNSVRRARNATDSGHARGAFRSIYQRRVGRGLRPRKLRYAGHYRIRPGRLGGAEARCMLPGHL